MNLSWFIARRLYSQNENNQKISRSAVTIATAGVALGMAIMILSVCIVVGFKQEIKNKIVGLGSHIQVVNYESLYSPLSKPIAVSDSMRQAIVRTEGVRHVQTFCLKSGMLKTDRSFQGVMFRGVGEDYDLDFLRSSLVEGTAKGFSATSNSGRLVISQRLAQDLGLKVGDRVYAYFVDEKLRARRFQVEGIYATNLSEYDKTLVFCDYRMVHQLLGFEHDQSCGLEIGLNDFAQTEEVTQRIIQKVNHRQDAYGAYFSTQNIKEKFPQIFSWLDLMDVNVVVILLLMLAVAGFTTISGLLIIILERTRFIGVMKALGAGNRLLRHIFIHFSVFLILKGILYGDILGIGLCFLQQRFGLVHLDATTYYVDAVPVQFHWPYLVLLNVGVFVISSLTLILPSYFVSRIHPAKSIRFE